MKILVDISGFCIKFRNKLVSILYYLNIKITYLLSWIIFSKRDGEMIGIKSFCPLFHPFAIASVPLVLFSFFFFAFLFHLLFVLSLTCAKYWHLSLPLLHFAITSSYYNTTCNRFYNNYVINICPRKLLWFI